jgi:hypothetical protein
MGERMWLTGAASNDLSRLLGRADGCCGADTFGGCGRCFLVQNTNSVNSAWTALVMKKSQCPPSNTACASGRVHIDIAAPGYDNLQWSQSNVCGSSARRQTFISRAQSTTCGDWWTRGGNTIQGCSCSALPTGTVEQQRIRAGCELFTSWGWRTGNPSLQYRMVTCPSRFVNIIGAAFGPTGLRNGRMGNETQKWDGATPLMEGMVVDDEPFGANYTFLSDWIQI